MANSPTFTTTPRFPQIQVSTANTARDGTGTLVDLIVATANGTLIKRIRYHAAVTTTAGMVRVFDYDGTNTRLLFELTVAAVTVSDSVAAAENEVSPSLILPSGHTLKVSTAKAEAINVFCEAEDF